MPCLVLIPENSHAAQKAPAPPRPGRPRGPRARAARPGFLRRSPRGPDRPRAAPARRCPPRGAAPPPRRRPAARAPAATGRTRLRRAGSRHMAENPVGQREFLDIKRAARLHMRLVAPGGLGDRLQRAGQRCAGIGAQLPKRRQRPRATGHEARPQPRHVRPLGQRMEGEHALRVGTGRVGHLQRAGGRAHRARSRNSIRRQGCGNRAARPDPAAAPVARIGHRALRVRRRAHIGHSATRCAAGLGHSVVDRAGTRFPRWPAGSTGSAPTAQSGRHLIDLVERVREISTPGRARLSLRGRARWRR